MTRSFILPFALFALALIGVVRANDQQTQQACVNAAICLLAVRSGLLPDRRPESPSTFHYFGLSRVPWLGRVSECLPWCFLKGETMRTSVTLSVVLLLTTSILAQAQDQAVTVGPWAIATSSKAEKFDSCTMSRSTNDLDVSFVRGRDGLLLLLDSSKWKLERGKAYTVILVAGSRSLDAKALAESKGVSIPLADRLLNAIRSAGILEVRGEGATLRVPLDGSMAALARLETCFEKNSRQDSDTNPFVAPNRKP
jgi:hypothetical protein